MKLFFISVFALFAFVILAIGGDEALLVMMFVFFCGGASLLFLVPPLWRAFKKSSRVIKFLLVILLAGASIVMHVYIVNSNNRMIFEAYIADPVPAGIHIMRTVESRWLDANTLIIFKAEPSLFRSLLDEYEPISIKQAKISLQGSRYWLERENLPLRTYKFYRRVIVKKHVKQAPNKFVDYRWVYYLSYNEKTNKAFFNRGNPDQYKLDEAMKPFPTDEDYDALSEYYDEYWKDLGHQGAAP